MFDVLVVSKIDFLGKEETFLHADAEISDALHLLAL